MQTLKATYAHRSSTMLDGADLRRYQATATYRRARARKIRGGLAWGFLVSVGMWAALVAPVVAAQL